MSKTITAKIPARKMSWGGKTNVYPARIDVFTQDDEGRWSSVEAGALLEAEVIDICRDATNWAEIKAAHFQMAGFHS